MLEHIKDEGMARDIARLSASLGLRQQTLTLTLALALTLTLDLALTLTLALALAQAALSSIVHVFGEISDPEMRAALQAKVAEVTRTA